MKKIKFALLPAFLVAIVGAFAAQGSSKPNLVQYYVKTSPTATCNSTPCQPLITGSPCPTTGTFYSTKTALGECQNEVTATFRLP